ncbi:MAG: DUF296 domain-containing protein [Anaerolineae bacterium]|nr:DUF296 domain-containing protein [Anaerolineae bacterium]
MRVRQVDGRFLIRLEAEEEAIAALRSWAAAYEVAFAVLWAIGTMRRAILGYWEPTTRTYRQISVEEQVEVVSMIGNVARDGEGTPIVHAHGVLSRSDGSTVGGHLMEGVVFPMLEVVARVFPERIHRRADPTTHLMIWDF